MIVYKYTLNVGHESQSLHLPGFTVGRIEHLMSSVGDKVNMWAVLDRAPHVDDPEWKFRVIGTGMPYNGDIWKWVGSTPPHPEYGLVWHVLQRLDG